MLRLCLSVASLALLTSRLVCVVLLANRLSLVLPYLLSYHTLLSSAVVSNFVRNRSKRRLSPLLARRRCRNSTSTLASPTNCATCCAIRHRDSRWGRLIETAAFKRRGEGMDSR